MATQTFTDRDLTIELDDGERVRVAWRGKSTAREPSQFVLPVLTKALELAAGSHKEVLIDFSQLQYMNSSTITPLIRILEQAKRGTVKVKVIYQKALKWQALSFTALRVFQTDDQRIEITGQ